MGRRWWPILLALAIAAPASPSGAHTQVQDASPGPGEVVRGTVDAVEVDFLDPVLPTTTITVLDPDGSPVAGLGATELVADDVARARFDPLTEPGRYQVQVDYASLDGFPQQAAHQFTLEPADGGDVAVRPLLAGAVGVVVAGLVASAVRERVRQAR